MRRLAGILLVTGLAAAGSAEVMVRDLPNGLRWIHRPVTHNRIFAFELFLPGGVTDEPAEKAGVTRLMAAAMLKGTESRDAFRLAREIESLGASFGLDAQADYIAMGGQVVDDRWSETFELFEDILLHPAFRPEEVDKERAALLNALATSHEHIFNVAEERLRKEIFGEHPYGRPEEGSEASLKALTPGELAEWRERRLSPRGAVLVTVGPVPHKALEARVTGLARKWTSSATPAAPAPVRYPSGPARAEERREFEQAYFMRAHPAPPVSDPAYPAVKVLNTLLGGGMSSPLFRTVREEGTLAYEVSSYFPSRRAGSALVIYAGVDPANRVAAEAKIDAVLKDLADRPPSPQELADAQSYIRGHYLMDHQTNGRIAWYLGWWELMGHGYAHDARYPGVISAVTPEEVHAAAVSLLARPPVTVSVVPTSPGR